MKIPFVNLGKQYLNLKSEIISKFDEISKKGEYILGSELNKFESDFSKFCGTKYSVGLGNGSDGLTFSLLYFNIKKGDEVLLPVNSFVATAWTVANVGAKPVFIDVSDDYNMDTELIEKNINSKTKAIIPVHLTGNISKVDKILNISKKYNLKIIEDAAQAVGAKYNKKMAGSFGNVASFSLHPLKNLHVSGDGGIITTNNKSIYNFMKKIRNHGLKNRDELEFWGYNSRLDNIHAAIGRIKLKYINRWNNRFRKIASYYSEELKNIVTIPIINKKSTPVFHRYIIQSKYRDRLKNFLFKKGIDTRINYPIPLHLHKASKYLNYKKGDFPNAEQQSKHILSLPIYNELSDNEVDYVVKSVKKFYKYL